MDQPSKDKDDKKPGIPIPMLRDTPSKPGLFKIKGLSSGMSLIERLKQFKKKDMAFILAGLGVLFMAPLAEHFLMAPSDESGAFKEGWGYRDGASGFGKGGSPYEGGVSGLAPGGMIGGGSDVITPLNVRDPSALVMGPGATQQPPAVASTPPPASPPAKESSDWKDALANAATKGAKEATKKASLPVPKVPLSAGGLRGLGAAGGGGGGNFSLGAPSAGNVPNKAAGSGDSFRNARATSGFRGAANARGPGTGAGGLEALKKAAGQAGSDLNRTGPAGSNLETAANRNMNVGGSDGGGGPGQGKEDKATAQSQSKDAKSPGESLDFLDEKDRRQKERDLDFKLREKEAMLWPNLREKLLEEAVMTPFKALTAGIAEAVKGIGGSHKKGDKYKCDDGTEYPRSIPKCSDNEGKAPCCITADCGTIKGYGSAESKNCKIVPGEAETTANPDTEDGSAGASENAAAGSETRAGSYRNSARVFGPICGRLQSYINVVDRLPANVKTEADTHKKAACEEFRQAILHIYTANWAMTGGEGSPPRCGELEVTPININTAKFGGSRNLAQTLVNLKGKFVGAATPASGSTPPSGEDGVLTIFQAATLDSLAALELLVPNAISDVGELVDTHLGEYYAKISEYRTVCSDSRCAVAGHETVTAMTDARAAVKDQADRIEDELLAQEPVLPATVETKMDEHKSKLMGRIRTLVNQINRPLEGMESPLETVNSALNEAEGARARGHTEVVQMEEGEESGRTGLEGAEQQIQRQYDASRRIQAQIGRATHDQLEARVYVIAQKDALRTAVENTKKFVASDDTKSAKVLGDNAKNMDDNQPPFNLPAVPENITTADAAKITLGSNATLNGTRKTFKDAYTATKAALEPIRAEQDTRRTAIEGHITNVTDSLRALEGSETSGSAGR